MRGRTVGENGIDREHVVAHRAIAKRSTAAGIVARHAPDRGARRRRDIDREPQPLRLQLAIEFVEYNARLDATAPPFGVERQNFGKRFRTINDQRGVHRLPALGGSRASWENGDVARPGDAQGSRRLFDRARNDHAERRDLIERGVGRVTASRESVELDFAHALVAQRALQPCYRPAHSAIPSLGAEWAQLAGQVKMRRSPLLPLFAWEGANVRPRTSTSSPHRPALKPLSGAISPPLLRGKKKCEYDG